MGHVGLHDFARLVLGQPRRRVVDRLVEAVAAERAERGEAPEVLARGDRIHHRRQRRRIRRHDEILREPALQAEAADAEVRVLVREVHVPRVVGGFRDSPWNAALFPVPDLPAHDEAVGVLEQAARRRVEHEVGHEVLEHRAGPGEQRRSPADGGQGPAEMEPVLDGHVAARDRHEARQTRLRGQQVVVPGVERPFQGPVADREEIPRVVVEEREVHPRHETVGLAGERRQSGGQRLPRLERGARSTDVAGVARDRSAQRLGPRERRPGFRRTFAAEGPHDVHERLGADRERGQPRGPLLGGLRHGRQLRAGVAERRLELP